MTTESPVDADWLNWNRVVYGDGRAHLGSPSSPPGIVLCHYEEQHPVESPVEQVLSGTVAQLATEMCRDCEAVVHPEPEVAEGDVVEVLVDGNLQNFVVTAVESDGLTNTISVAETPS